MHDIIQRVSENNSNFGGGYIEHAGEQYTVRVIGRATDLADLQNIVLLSRNGVPILIKDVATVREAPAFGMEQL